VPKIKLRERERERSSWIGRPSSTSSWTKLSVTEVWTETNPLKADNGRQLFWNWQQEDTMMQRQELEVISLNGNLVFNQIQNVMFRIYFLLSLNSHFFHACAFTCGKNLELSVSQTFLNHLLDHLHKCAPYVSAVVSKVRHYLIKSVTWPPLSDSSSVWMEIWIFQIQNVMFKIHFLLSLNSHFFYACVFTCLHGMHVWRINIQIYIYTYHMQECMAYTRHSGHMHTYIYVRKYMHMYAYRPSS
jgi:hypothetical protein